VRSVHLLGVGMVVGMLALGSMLAVMGYQWQESTYGQKAVTKVEFPPDWPIEAPSPQQISQGRSVFQQRCAACHTIGGGDTVGPDLVGVTNRRPYAWLQEIIVEPERLYERSDPIMTELTGQFPANMPNTGTTPAEAANIIAFLHTESPAPAPPLKVPAEGTPADKEPAAPPAQKPAAGQLAPAAEGGRLSGAPLVATGGHALLITRAAILLAQAPPGTQANGDVTRGQQLYQQMCAGCHTIGGGRRAGPDLDNVTEQRDQEWIVETIVDPGARHARGDPTAQELQREYGMQMPDLGVTEPQALDLIAYIGAQSAGAGIPEGPAPQVELPPGDAERGRALFLGTQRFSGGGPGCIACHDIEGAGYLQGGTWARDLGGGVGRMGPTGFASITQAPPFPAMRVAYGDEHFTNQELADLVAFVEGTQAGTALPGGQLFPLFGLILFGVMAGASHLIWRGRARQQREPSLTYRRY
jgi:mono/diheme cytochrome c family protein